MPRREAYRLGRTSPPSSDAAAEAQEESQAAQLNRLGEELRNLKSQDRAAKLNGQFQLRPELGRRIHELVKAIEAARGETSG